MVVEVIDLEVMEVIAYLEDQMARECTNKDTIQDLIKEIGEIKGIAAI